MSNQFPTKLWKEVERRIGRFFNSKRVFGSGGFGHIDGTTRSDSDHKHLYIEAKLRSNTALRTLYERTKVNAVKEGKLPILCIADKGKHGFLIVVLSNHLRDFFKIFMKGYPGAELQPDAFLEDGDGYIDLGDADDPEPADEAGV